MSYATHIAQDWKFILKRWLRLSLLYLLCPQVPFRCVDEINQGMDEINEKRVWGILVDTANEHSAQFFYLAPKYPQGLQFEKNMHIHVCFNGGMEHEDEGDSLIDVDAFIKELRSKSGWISW